MSKRWMVLCLAGAVVVLAAASALSAADPPHPLMQWVKRHPLPSAAKPSPRMGYETAYGYDPLARLLIRYGGHNQGGGGEQNSEVWTYDLAKDVWALREPNDAPPGVCCAQQDVFDDAGRKFIRFPAFSGSHGWQSRREIWLKDGSVWTYDLPTNTWRAMRPCPAPSLGPLRGAAYDPRYQVTVVQSGEGANHAVLVYDLYANAWHEMKPPKPAPEENLSQPGFTFDAVHGLFVLFGSQFQTDTRTWLYDLVKNRWSVLDVPDHPPADVKEASPVLAADTRTGIVLCSIRHEGKHETWALDVKKPAWTRLKLPGEPDPSGGRNRVLVYLPDHNLFVLENRTPSRSEGGTGEAEQQMWTFRYADAPAGGSLPAELTVTTETAGATLSWKAPPGAAPAAWNVYRGEGARPWEVSLEPVAKAVKGETFKDTGLKAGGLYSYQVRPADAAGKEGGPSFVARTQPPVVTDVCVSAAEAKRVDIAWPKSPAEDVVGYHVERADAGVFSSDQLTRIKSRYRPASDLAVGRVKAIGTFRRLTSAPQADVRFADTAADLAAGPKEPAEPLLYRPRVYPEDVDAGGKPYRYAVYAYRVIAVNRLGVESGPSPVAFTYPSAVQHVFSKEEGAAATRLKWRANPEKSVKGYLVYRHDGRYDKELIVRLTPEPVAATEFADEKAGKDTRRYEIVAVDALGQEGEPSQPVWSRREWARFYAPYTGEWHQ